VRTFKRALRHAQVGAILSAFEEFNTAGGAIVPLQTGKVRILPQIHSHVRISK
jgi:hypothetical protein